MQEKKTGLRLIALVTALLLACAGIAQAADCDSAAESSIRIESAGRFDADASDRGQRLSATENNHHVQEQTLSFALSESAKLKLGVVASDGTPAARVGISFSF